MSIVRGIVIIVVCGLTFGAAGGLVGVTLGAIAPSYYRGVFQAGNDPTFRPILVGLGLGLSQGMIGGLAIGSVALMASALSGLTRLQAKPPVLSAKNVDFDRPRPAHLRRAILGLVLVGAGLVLGGLIGFLAGALLIQVQTYRHLSETKIETIRPVLRDPKYAHVHAEPTSDGGAILIGRVESEQVYQDLEEEMRLRFGVETAKFLMNNIEVAGE